MMKGPNKSPLKLNCKTEFHCLDFNCKYDNHANRNCLIRSYSSDGRVEDCHPGSTPASPKSKLGSFLILIFNPYTCWTEHEAETPANRAGLSGL